MTAAGTGDELNTLRIRAEQALQRDLPRDHVRGLLETLAERAVEGSPEACFANRHLAEMLLEESPWRAALHLRRLLKSCPEDDAGHALMGLSQALQANYRMAVSSFRRAVAISPANPWYHHNLGHLLDVALSRPQDAVAHLQRAFRAQPAQEEVGASFAQCLGRLGRCAEGMEIVAALLLRHPRHAELLALKSWLERGAPAGARGPSVLARAQSSKRARPEPDPSAETAAAVRAGLARLGRSPAHVDAALAVWASYESSGRGEVPLDGPTLAAIDYMAARRGGQRVTQKHVAAEHGVTANALSVRYSKIRLRLMKR
jgi:Flp pilus assembly protein TadD